MDFEEIKNEIECLNNLEVSEEESEFRPILKELGRVGVIQYEIECSGVLDDVQRRELLVLLEEKKKFL